MMHFGVSDQDKTKPGIQIYQKDEQNNTSKNLLASLEELKKKVDYLALGHFHNYYQIPKENPWIFNPGSLETTDLKDVEKKRGAFLVETFGKEQLKFQVKHYECENGDPNNLYKIPLEINDMEVDDKNLYY